MPTLTFFSRVRIVFVSIMYHYVILNSSKLIVSLDQNLFNDFKNGIHKTAKFQSTDPKKVRLHPIHVNYLFFSYRFYYPYRNYRCLDD